MTEAAVQHILKEEEKKWKTNGKRFFIKTFVEPEVGTNDLYFFMKALMGKISDLSYSFPI